MRIFSSFSSRRVVVGSSRNRPPRSGQSRTSTAGRLRARRLRTPPEHQCLHHLVAWAPTHPISEALAPPAAPEEFRKSSVRHRARRERIARTSWSG